MTDWHPDFMCRWTTNFRPVGQVSKLGGTGTKAQIWNNFGKSDLVWTFKKIYRFRGYCYHYLPKLAIEQIPSVPICSTGPAKSTYISICTLNMLLYFCSILADLHTIPDLMSCHVPKSSSEWHVIFVWSWTDDSILEAHQREPEQLLACYNDGN